MNENLLNISNFSGCFPEGQLRTGGKHSFLFTQIAFVAYDIFIKSIKRATVLFLKQVSPKSVLEMPFCITKS